LRKRLHQVFDRLWMGKMRRDGCRRYEARRAGYQWLAEQMEIDEKDCHIGKFDEDRCQRAIAICEAVGKTA